MELQRTAARKGERQKAKASATYRACPSPHLPPLTFSGAYDFALTLRLKPTYEELDISVPNTSQGARAASARAFVHSLKSSSSTRGCMAMITSARRCSFETTWNELRAGSPTTGDQGFLLGVSDNKLLLDGIPLETGNSERSFCDAVAPSAGLGQPSFFPRCDGGRFCFDWCARLPWPDPKAQDVSKQIKAALGANKPGQHDPGINEVKFVAADPLTGDVSIAAQIAAQT